MHEIWSFHSSVAEDSSDTVLLRGQLFPQQWCWRFKWYYDVERAVVSTAVLLKIQVIQCCWEGSCFHSNGAEDSSDTMMLRGQLFPQQCCWRFKWYNVVERAVVSTAVSWRFKWYYVVDRTVFSTAVLLKIQVILSCWEGSCFYSSVAEDSSDTMLLTGQLFPQQCCWRFKWYYVLKRAVVSTAVLLKIQVTLCCWEGRCFHSSVADDSNDNVFLRGQLFPQQCCWRFKWFCVVERADVSTAVLLKIQVILCCWQGSCFHSSVAEDSSDTMLLRGQFQHFKGPQCLCLQGQAVPAEHMTGQSGYTGLVLRVANSHTGW